MLQAVLLNWRWVSLCGFFSVAGKLIYAAVSKFISGKFLLHILLIPMYTHTSFFGMVERKLTLAKREETCRNSTFLA